MNVSGNGTNLSEALSYTVDANNIRTCIQTKPFTIRVQTYRGIRVRGTTPLNVNGTELLYCARPTGSSVIVFGTKACHATSTAMSSVKSTSVVG